MFKKTFNVVVLTLFIIAVLTGCSSNAVPDNNNHGEDERVYTEDGKIAPTQSYNGKTAIIKKDTELYDAYVITLSEVNSAAEDKLRLTLIKRAPQILKKNDIILVLEEADEYCRIFVPYGTLPTFRGKVEKNAISYDVSLFASANQAVLNNVSAYDGINGHEIGLKNGRGIIAERKDGWVLIGLPGGDLDFWVKESDLSFDFDAQIEDVDPYIKVDSSSGLSSPASMSGDFVVKNGVLTRYAGADPVEAGDSVPDDIKADIIVNIPDNLGITAIGGMAFSHRPGISAVNIPKGVVSIGEVRSRIALA